MWGKMDRKFDFGIQIYGSSSIRVLQRLQQINKSQHKDTDV